MLHSAVVKKMTATVKPNKTKVAAASLKSSIKAVFAEQFFSDGSSGSSNGNGERGANDGDVEAGGGGGKQKAKSSAFQGYSDSEKKMFSVTATAIDSSESRALTALDEVLSALRYAAWHAECSRVGPESPVMTLKTEAELSQWFQASFPAFAGTVSFCVAIWLKFLFAGTALLNGKECRAWSSLRPELQATLCKSQEKFLFESPDSQPASTAAGPEAKKRRVTSTTSTRRKGSSTDGLESINALELADVLLKTFVDKPVTSVATGIDDDEDESSKTMSRIISWMRRSDVVTPLSAFIKETMNNSLTLHSAPRDALRALSTCPHRVNLLLLDGLAIIFNHLQKSIPYSWLVFASDVSEVYNERGHFVENADKARLY